MGICVGRSLSGILSRPAKPQILLTQLFDLGRHFLWISHGRHIQALSDNAIGFTVQSITVIGTEGEAQVLQRITESTSSMHWRYLCVGVGAQLESSTSFKG